MRTIDLPGVRPIRHLLVDPEIAEIMINGPERVFVERRGMTEAVPAEAADPLQMEVLVENLLAHTGRTLSRRAPMVDFRLDDGTRVNIVIPPIALGGAVITIRKHTGLIRSLDDLADHGSLTGRVAAFLAYAVQARLNIVFSGGAGSGKTTTLGLLTRFIAPEERVVVIEDTAELDLSLPHCVRLECRPPNHEGAGGIALTDLLKNALRMRPRRILVGEVRGDEAFEMLHAMSSGHDGSMCVLHASSPSHAISRLELMLISRGLPLPLWAIQRQIAASVDLVVQHAIGPDGVRRITHVSEVGSVDREQVSLRHLYQYRLDRISEEGRAVGAFVCGGVTPSFVDRLRLVAGDRVDDLFAPGET
ncbi:Flp pilus assembly complex ATPase component TadA [Myxococcota bacterium]|nr:Flp pilus assembly complex ATPase component TadA [Myxococcota bacterium]